MGGRKNPFKPGTGLAPPVRAGREKIVRTLDQGLQRVLEKAPGNLIVMCGPRGNGKTTLLVELECKARAAGTTVRRRTPNGLRGTAEYIARDLTSDGDAQVDVSGSIEASLGFLKGGVKVAPAQTRLLEAVFRNLAKAKPTVLLVDEAHMLPAELGNDLLNAIQACVSDGLPLLAVLAGTPGIEGNLRKMGASFWERCKRLRIGRLESPDDVRTALAIPAERSGMPFDDDALELLVGESQGYPYFVQVLGEASWDEAEKAGHDRITLADARNGLEESESERNAFYLGRRNEADENGVLAEAEAVSRKIMGKGPDAALTESELSNALKEVLGPDRHGILAAKHKLSNLGLIWQTPGNTWEPGIPSLCGYISSQSAQG